MFSYALAETRAAEDGGRTGAAVDRGPRPVPGGQRAGRGRCRARGRGPDEIGPEQVRERYGIDPALVPDFIALRGDPSDGLPGAPGIGAKTAAELLQRYGSLEEVLQVAARTTATCACGRRSR